MIASKAEAFIYEQLSQPLPPAALRTMPNSEFLSINDAYVKERLNKVLGPQGWSLSEPKIVSIEKVGTLWDATVTVKVSIKLLKKIYHGQGGHQNADKGDALKGAVTDAFGKALSDLIGIEVYKGLLNPTTLRDARDRNQFMVGVECGFVYAEQGMSKEAAMDEARREWEKGNG